jgi:THO complex subunit 4
MSENVKLDQSLDSILAARKKNAPRRSTTRRRAPVGTKATAAPVGGVKKAVRPAKKTETLKSAAKPAPRRDSKIIVSNLVRTMSQANLPRIY